MLRVGRPIYMMKRCTGYSRRALRRHRMRFATSVLLGGIAACDLLPGTDPVVCPAAISRAIEVEVRDAVSGAPAAADAVGTARDGSFVEVLQVVGWTGAPADETALLLGGVNERAGTYTVTVDKAGYERWERASINVRRSICGVETARLEARLTRSAGATGSSDEPATTLRSGP